MPLGMGHPCQPLSWASPWAWEAHIPWIDHMGLKHHHHQVPTWDRLQPCKLSWTTSSVVTDLSYIGQYEPTRLDTSTVSSLKLYWSLEWQITKLVLSRTKLIMWWPPTCFRREVARRYVFHIWQGSPTSTSRFGFQRWLL